jgi:hypothetical protein
LVDPFVGRAWAAVPLDQAAFAGPVLNRCWLAADPSVGRAWILCRASGLCYPGSSPRNFDPIDSFHPVSDLCSADSSDQNSGPTGSSDPCPFDPVFVFVRLSSVDLLLLFLLLFQFLQFLLHEVAIVFGVGVIGGSCNAASYVLTACSQFWMVCCG